MENSHCLSRRELVTAAAGLAALSRSARAAAPRPRLRLAVMSKFFQFMDVPHMAEAVAGMGFDGIDLCVRPGAHVLPERAAEDLPKAVAAIRGAGLEVPMITSGIVDTGTPHTVTVLRAAASLGIRHYRWGTFRYDPQQPIAAQLEGLKPRVAELAKVNRELGVCAMYHTHSGIGQVGASIWDLWLLLRDHDPRWVSANLDIAHATVEGGLGGWIHSTRLILPLTRGIAIKDFRWGKNAKGEWRPEWCPLGEGMVDYKRYLGMLKSAGFNGPVQMHYEYDLGGADRGAATVTLPPQQIYAAMRKDLDLIRRRLVEVDL